MSDEPLTQRPEETPDHRAMSHHWKVIYTTFHGHKSTAYVQADHPDSTQCEGTDKYTDAPITVRWHNDEWRQVGHGSQIEHLQVEISDPVPIYYEPLNRWVQARIKWRNEQIEAVCELADSDGRYGVMVDCDGVRLSKDVPARTIHYYDQHCLDQDEWRADFSIPE